jgi:hypothetical protein
MRTPRSLVAAMSFGAALAIPTIASAVINTRIDVLISTDGANFVPSMLLPSNVGTLTVEVKINVSYIGTATALGLNRFSFQPTVSNWAPTDALLPITAAYGTCLSTPSGSVPDAPGQYGRIHPFAWSNISITQRLTGHVHLNGGNGAPAGNWLRIAQLQITSWMGGAGNTTGAGGIPLSQPANIGRTNEGPPFVPDLVAVTVFRYAVALDTTTFRAGPVVCDIPANGFGNLNTSTGEREVWWYANRNEASGSIRGTAVVVPAVIVPTPPGTLLLTCGILAWSRRRRSPA